MKTLVKKLGQLRKLIEAQRGEFILYALVLPDDAITWDLLVSATWIDEDQSAALRYLAKEIQSVLAKQELFNLSGILIADSDQLTTGMWTESEPGWEETDIDFYGRHVQKAYIFVSPVDDFHVSLNR